MKEMRTVVVASHRLALELEPWKTLVALTMVSRGMYDGLLEQRADQNPAGTT